MLCVCEDVSNTKLVCAAHYASCIFRKTTNNLDKSCLMCAELKQQLHVVMLYKTVRARKQNTRKHVIYFVMIPHQTVV